MIAAVADTHSVVWLLLGDRRLSQRARETFEDAASRGQQIAVSTITLAELLYLTEKGRLPSEVVETLLAAFDAQGALVEAPFDRAVAMGMRRVPRDQVPDLPDRIIAATGQVLGVPVISRDAKIQASDVATIW